MTQRKKRTKKEARAERRRQQQSFTGREDQLHVFQTQLALPGDDPRWRDVLSFHGQGGVGKTTLLREFARIASNAGALAAMTDEYARDTPATMARLVADLVKSGGPEAAIAFSKFNDRHAAYLKKRDELQADREAPPGLAGLLAVGATRLGARLVRGAVPGSALVLDAFEEPLVDQAAQLAEYARRKLGGDAHLVLEPEAVLTPLFAEGLTELGATRRIVLLFDTYEHTAGYLDPWLRDLLDGRHGDLPDDLLIVIAGREELSRNDWAEFVNDVARLPLEPFTEEEARAYLARRDIEDERVIAVILSLSGRLPLLLATLAAGNPQDPDQVGDASGTAVERFLKWVDHPARRALALDAALPRRLNRDVAKLLGGDAPGFDWLITNPFVQRLPGDEGWAYHDVVREQMLRYKRAESPAGWAALHERLAAHYRAMRDELNPERQAGLREPAWRAAALEELYHRLCARPQAQLPAALNEAVAVLDERWTIANEWAATLAAAGKDANHAPLRDWGQSLRRGLQAYEDDQYEIAAETFSRLIDSNVLEPANQAVVLSRRGTTCLMIGRYEGALADFSQAIELDPKYTWVIATRGLTCLIMGRYEEALADFDRVIELKPEYTWVIAIRGMTYQQMERYEAALADFDRVIELNPEDAQAIAIGGEAHRQMGKYENEMENLYRAIGPDYILNWALTGRSATYRQIGEYEKALEDLNRAIELKPEDDWVIGSRGETYRQMGRYEEALEDLNRAIELDPEYAWAIGSRGQTYRQMGRYEEALEDLNRAIELKPELDWAISSRGETYRQMGRYEEALEDLNRAIELDPEYAWAIGRRGETYRQMGRYEEALEDLNRALELDPEYAWAIGSRGETYRQIGRYEEALADFDQAVELRPDNDWYLYQRAITRRRLDSADFAADLNEAIRIAATRKTTPTNLRNVFNLALYHAARGDDAPAEALYREGLAALPSEGLRREALIDLDQYLALFPGDELAGRMRALLAAAWGDLTAGPPVTGS